MVRAAAGTRLCEASALGSRELPAQAPLRRGELCFAVEVEQPEAEGPKDRDGVEAAREQRRVRRVRLVSPLCGWASLDTDGSEPAFDMEQGICTTASAEVVLTEGASHDQQEARVWRLPAGVSCRWVAEAATVRQPGARAVQRLRVIAPNTNRSAGSDGGSDGYVVGWGDRDLFDFGEQRGGATTTTKKTGFDM
eukprot:COSAG01_NODE_1494_length_10125_cov_93.590805_2_plen_194_part_00